jgi:hypothetical protein
VKDAERPCKTEKGPGLFKSRDEKILTIIIPI